MRTPVMGDAGEKSARRPTGRFARNVQHDFQAAMRRILKREYPGSTAAGSSPDKDQAANQRRQGR